jgi:spore coat polysaccharide biosynthesis protein SpsF
MDSTVIDNLILEFEKNDADYCMFSNGIYGLSAEVFSFESLALAYENVVDDFDKEHVTPYIKKNCKTHIVDIERKYRNPDIRATIDTLDDFVKMSLFFLDCKRKNITPNIDNFINFYDQTK